MQTKESVERQYELLKELYGIQSSGWSMLHERFNRYVFCEANRKSLIAEYLMWEEFVEEAKRFDVVYYYGIDLFLKEYKNAVYSCLNGLEETNNLPLKLSNAASLILVLLTSSICI